MTNWVLNSGASIARFEQTPLVGRGDLHLVYKTVTGSKYISCCALSSGKVAPAIKQYTSLQNSDNCHDSLRIQRVCSIRLARGNAAENLSAICCFSFRQSLKLPIPIIWFVYKSVDDIDGDFPGLGVPCRCISRLSQEVLSDSSA